jgi:ferredoxin
MKLVVDHSKCQGHAMCYASAPNVFVLDDDGYNRMNPVIVDPADLRRNTVEYVVTSAIGSPA